MVKRILVCGGRDYLGRLRMDIELDRYLAYNGLSDKDVTIIQGGAKGADFLAKVIANEKGWECVEYPANWRAYGKKAGMIRNQQMIDQSKPDVVIAFPGGNGTNDMVKRAEKAGVKVLDYRD